MAFLKAHKRFFIVTLVIICVTLMFLTATYKVNPELAGNIISYVVSPVQSGFTKAGNWISGKIGFLVNLSNIQSENESLKRQIDELISQNSQLRLVYTENEKLSQLLNIDRKYANYPKMGAEVIAKDPGNWYNAFYIDKGSNNGLQKNMVVLASGGLIGRIAEARPNSSLVVSIIDDVSAVSAKSSRTNDGGVVRGDSSLMTDGLIRMEFASLEVDVVVGDEIVTSQLSSIYPPGIIIGYVTEIRYDSKGMKVAIVKPTTDFSLVETVLVITELFDRAD